MARYTDAKCRLCRSAGEKLFLKGGKCFSTKCPLSRRSYKPGIHGSKGSRKPSDYGLQLKEKQKAKRIYGLLEKQFRNYVGKAQKKTNTGFALLKMLESRLDSFVFLAGLASSRDHARQLVSHGNVTVNGKKNNIPSYNVKEKDKIVVDKAKFKKNTEVKPPKWVTVKGNEAVMGDIATREDIETNINEQLIIEYYTR